METRNLIKSGSCKNTFSIKNTLDGCYIYDSFTNFYYSFDGTVINEATSIQLLEKFYSDTIMIFENIETHMCYMFVARHFVHSYPIEEHNKVVFDITNNFNYNENGIGAIPIGNKLCIWYFCSTYMVQHPLIVDYQNFNKFE